MKSLLKVGVDVGSTTIKLVILDHQNELVYKRYLRHFSEIGAAVKENIAAISHIVEKKPFSLAFTGSAGMGMAEKLRLAFVQEVIACSTAVRKLIPQTDTAIELGGEDAKITYFGESPEQRMNGVCAGGTGSFIDHMASLLHTDAGGLNRLAEKGQQIYTIASRCGVFAKTDIQALMNDGAAKADIALSVFQAVVNQTIGNLAQGRPIQGNIAFLGGPLHFLPALRQRFIETLQLSKDRVVPVEDGCYFVAVGAALAEEAEIVSFDALQEKLGQMDILAEKMESAAFPLFSSEEEYTTFKTRHARDQVRRGELSAYKGPVYIGIDAGSTTTKIVAAGKDKEVLYTSYGSNHGSPLETVLKELQGLYRELPEDAYIAGTGTTGYGEYIVKAAVHADFGEVETFAHLRAAQEFCPDVSFVLDIGGQDMKCFFVRNQAISQITLNEACSAGCGSFIENFAQGLQMTAADFAGKAILAKSPVDLGTRCTVFMNSKVKQAQKDGADVSDISAGIALSVIKNALFKVIQIKDTEELGDSIVVQGGTFYNDAVLRAMELLLKRDVVRPDIAGLMGAYGMALLAMERQGEKSALLSAEQLQQFSMRTSSYRCRKCGNQCLITIQHFPDGEKYYTGNRCERGIGSAASVSRAPNIYAYKYERLFSFYQPLEHPSRGMIGLPRVLNMYEDYPFWFTFFTELGYQVVLSDKSSAEMYYKGMATVPSDSLCYPAKIVHGHIMDLAEKGLKKIFYPCIPYNMADDCNRSDNHYNCPVVASYAENIRANMDVLQEEKIRFYQPFLPLNDRKRLISRLQKELAEEGLGRAELEKAVGAAYQALSEYKQDVQAYGRKILKEIEEKKEPAILLAGRPYHIDPEINHGIPELIQSYGIPVLSEDAVYHLPINREKLEIVNQWSYHARLYHAAEYVGEHDHLTMIQLSSFGCGLDAITIGQVRDILDAHDRIYTMIKLDEVSNLGAARIRLRSLLAAMKQKRGGHTAEAKISQPRPLFTEECRQGHTILAPQMAPIHFDLITFSLKKYGYKMLIPEMSKQEAIDLGLRYVNNDMCYPAIVVIGQLLSALTSGKCDPDNTSIMLFQTCGACRATNYLNLLRKALRDAGYPQVPVFACWGMEKDAFSLHTDGFADIIKSTVYADLLMQVMHRTQPYEAVPGAAGQLFRQWMERCRQELLQGSYQKFAANIKGIAEDFEALPLLENVWKPRVGIVGEILVKYHPTANNGLEEILAAEGAEVVMPSLLDFYLYLAYDAIAKRELLDGSLTDRLKAEAAIQVLESFRRPVRKALKGSRRFSLPHTIKEIAAMAKAHISLGNMAGEGWFLTGEMVKLLQTDTPNIICLQPFGCLPNHISGKGMIRELLHSYPGSNIVAVDCDAGVSEVNQLNRIKLMLSVARERQNPACQSGKKG